MSRKLPGSAIVPGSITLTQITGSLNDTTNAAYAQANTARNTANDAYGQANTARSDANTTFLTINTTFGTVNTNYQAAYAQANNARSDANTTFATVNTTFGTINTNYQAAYAQANLAYAAANSKVSSSGGAIVGDISITGNLFVNGAQTIVNTSSLTVNDPIFLLANNNTTNAVGLGFVAHYGATQKHTGLIRAHQDNNWYLFDEYDDHILYANNVLDTGNVKLATLKANVAANTLTILNGVSGNVNFDSGTLFVDSVGNSVGIGTTNPTQKLSINGRFHSDTNNNYYGAWGEGNTATNGYSFLAVGEWYTTSLYMQKREGQSFAHLYTYSNTHHIAMQAGSLDNGTTAGGGNVGIGTTNPASKLSVRGTTDLGDSHDSTTSSLHTTRLSGYALRYDASNRYGNYGVLIFSASHGWTSSAKRFMITNGINANKFCIIRSVDGLTDPTLGDGGSITSGTADFTIDSSGNVGVGTTSPVEKLQVSGGIKITGAATIASGSGTGLFLDYASNIGRITALDQGVAWRSLRLNAADIGFQIADGDVVRITSGGNVGVGTTSPSTKLHVRLPTTTSDVVQRWESPSYDSVDLYVGSTQAYFGTVSTTPLTFRTNNTERMRIASDGNVGVGTTNPGAKLDIEGSGAGGLLHVNNTTAGKSAMVFQDNGTQKLIIGLAGIWEGNSSTDAAIATESGSNIRFYTNGSATERLRIDTSGNVGIGTGTTTVTGLTLHGNGTGIRAQTSSDSANYYAGFTANYNYAEAFTLYAKGAGSQHSIIKWADAAGLGLNGGGGPVKLEYSGTEYMRLHTNGNVGIGTTSPATLLSLGSPSHTSPDETNRILNWYVSTSGTELHNSAHRITIGVDSSSTAQPQLVGMSLFNRNSTNNVWSPALIFGGMSTSGNYMNGSVALAAQLPAHAADTNFRGGDLHIFTQSTTENGLTSKFVLKAGGNVGIGTTNPTGKLHIYDTSNQSSDATLYIQSPSNNDWGIKVAKTGYDYGMVVEVDSSANYGIGIYAGSSYVLRATGSGNLLLSGTLTESSSIELKENIDPITNALDSITKLVGVTYDRKDGSAQNRAGLIAESVAKVLPNVVNGDGIQYTNLIAYLVESIKELKAEIDILKSK